MPVYVRHVATVPPEIGLGFAENSYNVEVPEDAGDNTLIKIITIINSHAHDTTPLKCEIYSGNEDDLFEAGVTEERNCALKLKKGALDYETTESYQVKIKLESLSGLLNSGRNTTMVNFFFFLNRLFFHNTMYTSFRQSVFSSIFNRREVTIRHFCKIVDLFIDLPI